MLKKLLKGCLAVAMVGAFATGVSAADLTWSGDAEGTFLQKSSKEATSGAKSESYMQFSGSGALNLKVSVPGDTWTAGAELQTDWDGAAITVDDVFATMSKDGMTILLGVKDAVGVGKGGDSLGPVDYTWGAGGSGYGDKNEGTINEKPLVMVSLTDVGLDVFLGMDRGTSSVDTSTDQLTPAKATCSVTGTSNSPTVTCSEDQPYNETYYGVIFKKAFGDIALAVEYVGYSTSINKDFSPGLEKGDYDGASATDIALAVQYTMGAMAFTLNYDMDSIKYGDDDEKSTNITELIFDMALDDTSGITFAYGTKADKATPKTGTETKVNYTNMTLGYKMATGGVNHYVGYATSSFTDDSSGKEETGEESDVGYRMEVTF